MKKKSSSGPEKRFSRILMKWDKDQNKRLMPWKGEKDPYRIWLSEIILQQTRVEQGLSYYQNFLRVFPDIKTLAKAPENKVFKQWEGLGYYSRCRNLISTAKKIANDLNGKFPSTYEDILALKGVGPYTAAAISSFAFDLPHAVVDGNVFRVLARIFGITIPLDTTKGKKYFTDLANELLDKKNPGRYNQAIMDFGAVICKPAPQCDVCVFQKDCYAFQHDRINQLPVKEKKISIKKRWFYYFIVEHDNRIAIRQRKEKDIWQDLYEFPLVELNKNASLKTAVASAEKMGWLRKNKFVVRSVSSSQRQQLSHQLIIGRFIHIVSEEKINEQNIKWIPGNNISRYAFPQFINQYLRNMQ